jgi:uncharacterized protein YecE (DUF72 family)
MILVGTSGFSYKDWVGPYYPAGLSQRDWLSFYAREFNTCELNFSYYRLPDARNLGQIAGKTPPGFSFAVKAYKELTHERGNPPFVQFAASLAPLVEQGKLGCVLAQFPYSFHATSENCDYLRRLRDGLGELPTVVEFRNAAWLAGERKTFDLLRELNLGYCCVDEPRLEGLIPPVTAATGPVAYVRFHGRNAAKWWQHEEAWQRYDYTYPPEELAEWVPKIQQLDQAAPLTLVYTNNHWRGQAVDTARQLKLMLAA